MRLIVILYPAVITLCSSHILYAPVIFCNLQLCHVCSSDILYAPKISLFSSYILYAPINSCRSSRVLYTPVKFCILQSYSVSSCNPVCYCNLACTSHNLNANVVQYASVISRSSSHILYAPIIIQAPVISCMLQ